MLIEYPSKDEQLEIGRPYTYGKGFSWYMRVSQADVLFLGTTAEDPELLPASPSASHIKSALSWPEFRYARTMEIN